LSKPAQGIVGRTSFFKGRVITAFVTINFVNETDKPVPDAECKIKFDDGEAIDLKTDGKGILRFPRKAAGDLILTLIGDMESSESDIAYPAGREQLPVLDLCNRNNPNPIQGHGPLGNVSSTPSRMSYDNAKGDMLELVELVQNMLSELAYDLGSSAVDGIFGNETESATKNFQKEHNDFEGKPLKKDGLIGPETSDALNRAMVGRWYPEYVTPKELTQNFLFVTVTENKLIKSIRLSLDGLKKAKVALMPEVLGELCCVYAQLYDDPMTQVLANTKYTLRGLQSGKVITGTTDEKGILHHEYIPEDNYELDTCGKQELVDVHYMSEKEKYDEEPWLIRLKGVKQATGKV
jgi:peptidoglycan hydrolase-like protein with peptidoglycan-binding domain